MKYALQFLRNTLVCAGALCTQWAFSLTLPPGAKLLGEGTLVAGAPQAYKVRLANGLRVLVIPDDRNPVGMFRMVLNAGSNREHRGETGLAHFFEHMMFRKTVGHDEGNYDRVLSGVGGQGNAFTTTDQVEFYSTFPGPALDRMLDLEAQRFIHLDIADPYYSIEKGAVISERSMRYENNPLERGREVLRAIVERGTPYEWLVIGDKADVKNMSLSAAKKFYGDFYTPDNALLTLGGPFDVATALAKIDSAFSSWKGKVAQHHIEFPKDYLTRDQGRTYVCSEAVMEQRHQLIYPSADTSFRGAVLAQVFEEMLNDNPEGKFSRRLLKHKLAAQAYVYKDSYQHFFQPYIVTFLMNNSQKAEPAIEYWNSAVAEVLKKPFTSRFRNRVLKQLQVQDAEMASRMTSLAENYEWNEYMYGNATIGKEAQTIVKHLTQEELRGWVKKNLVQTKPIHTGVVPKGAALTCAELAKKENVNVTDATATKDEGAQHAK